MRTSYVFPCYKSRNIQSICVVTFFSIFQNFNKKGPLSVVNSVVMYEAQLQQKSLLNSAAFCWSMLRDQPETIAKASSSEIPVA